MKINTKDVVFYVIIGVLVALIIVLSILYVTKNKAEPSYYENKCTSFGVQNANLSQGQIIFIGDSITDLYHLDDYYSDLSLATYNRGIGGDTTQGVIDRLKVSLFDLNPTKIVLMIGINDIGRGMALDGIVERYNTILSSIKQNLPTTQVYCMSVLSITQAVETQASRQDMIPMVKQLNPQIQQMATQYGYTYLDLFSQTVDSNDYLEPEYSVDGIHLSAEGFVKWTQLVKSYLL